MTIETIATFELPDFIAVFKFKGLELPLDVFEAYDQITLLTQNRKDPANPEQKVTYSDINLPFAKWLSEKWEKTNPPIPYNQVQQVMEAIVGCHATCKKKSEDALRLPGTGILQATPSVNALAE
jgi:hypothetical protein